VDEQFLRITYSSAPGRQDGIEITLAKRISPPIERLKKGTRIHLVKSGREIERLVIDDGAPGIEVEPMRRRGRMVT